MQKKELRRLVISALLLAVGIVLPMLTGQIKEIGDSLLPMHIPVMLCGVLCGAKYGSAVGACLPIIRALTFGMPPIYPNAIWMALELATYGAVIAILYTHLRLKGKIYISLIGAMLAGRVVWGIAKAILLGLGNSSFTVRAFLIGGFVDALPGIILQIVLIPLIITLIEKLRLKEES